MTQNRLTTRPATTRRRMVGGSLIGAVAVAGAAFGIVTPAHAGGVIPNIGSTLVVTKVDSATSAPLDVMSRQVVESADGCGSDCGVVPVMIVGV